MATIQKKHFQKIFWAFLCATIFTFVFTNHSVSATNPTGPAYYIQVLPTENQLNQNNAYFELNVG
ncbi:hypothetical protein [Periweissella fabalis]|uniref:Uncharacterized protein n=1 Tax=Periweissella fabalis TaxID=1070421 RepID=A0A7X6S405_9LACO|nr:hypothetical protein [Periweissella fabalis]MCM0598090.1 hypothetical protein [Periweissella fabalis]NKZ24786.1 hypothetical protein [Periweissella fabalis]